MLSRASAVRNTRHEGLGLDAYATFTSPLRRRDDIIAQKLLLEAIFQLPAHLDANTIDEHLRLANRKATGMDSPARLLALQRSAARSLRGLSKSIFLGVC